MNTTTAEHRGRTTLNTMKALQDLATKTVTDNGNSTAPSTWLPLDLGPFLAGTITPRRPIYLHRSDGECLLYEYAVHLLAGPPDSGKSWLLAMVAKVALENGQSVLWIDLEGQPQDLILRLRKLGLGDALIATVVYVSASEPMRLEDVDRWVTWCFEHPGCVVLIDSLGELVSLQGARPDADDEIKTLIRSRLRPMATAGATVLALDHVVKSKESRTGDAIGSQAKTGSVDVAFALDPITEFAPGRTGSVGIDIRKDRFGSTKTGATKPKTGLLRWGIMTVESIDADGPVTISFDKSTDDSNDSGTPGTANARLMDMHLLSVALINAGATTPTNGLSTTLVRSTSGWRYDRAKTALEWLVRMGNVQRVDGPRKHDRWYVETPFTPSDLADAVTETVAT